MNAAQKHALWLRPFGNTAFELEQRIKHLSKKYNTPLFEPHITMLSGLRRGETELIQLTDTLAGALSPFTVSLTDLNYQDNYFQSLYLKVEKSDAFIHAQQTAEKLFGCTTDEQYIPHLSLMYSSMDAVEKRKILNTLPKSYDLEFPVHSLLLIKTEGEVNKWKKIHAAEFKQTA